MEPKVTIIIPVYNAEQYIARCLENLKTQSFKNFEVILINDGSTDSSEVIINSFVDSDVRFRSFFQPNSGPSTARNLGIKKARGEYLSFIDADDWVRSDYLEKLLSPMSEGETDLVCAGYYEVNPRFPNGLELHDFQPDFFNTFIPKEVYQANLFKGLNGVLWGKLFKKEIFQKHKIQFHPALRLSEDLLVVLEYSKYIKQVFIIPDKIYFYNRLNENGLSSGLNIEKLKDLNLFFDELDLVKEELEFLNLDEIKRRRKFSFLVQLLQDQSQSKDKFYKTADFIYNNESCPISLFFPTKNFDYFLLINVFRGNFYKSWLALNLFKRLRRVKNSMSFLRIL